MRISKLFHWLYASIMLMPIFAIGVKSLYVTFNPNAKDSYNYVEEYEIVNTYYETNVVTQLSDLQYDKVYTFTFSQNYSGTINIPLDMLVIVSISNYSVDVGNKFDTLPYLRLSDNFAYIPIRDVSDTSIERYQTRNCVLDVVFRNITNDVPYQLFSQCERQYVKQTEIVEHTSTIDNVFYYSVEQISNESFFNWANGTFLAHPLLFITNLFGVPSTSPIITILCYWFAISVIWLVFDVIMYIPLLVHRWLDKGVIE